MNGIHTFFREGRSESAPLVVMNSFGDEWKHVAEELEELEAPDHAFLAVSGFEWNVDLSPWKAPAVFKGEPDFGGGADAYLEQLTNEIVPEAVRKHGIDPDAVYIAGYSMAGLFALYSLYKTGVFNGAASCSGSLWYPGFIDYVHANDFAGTPSKVYLSLGDREAKTRNPVMATVEDNAKAAATLYKGKGVDVVLEMNKGGHFDEPALRTAKGIAWLLG